MPNDIRKFMCSLHLLRFLFIPVFPHVRRRSLLAPKMSQRAATVLIRLETRTVPRLDRLGWTADWPHIHLSDFGVQLMPALVRGKCLWLAVAAVPAAGLLALAWAVEPPAAKSPRVPWTTSRVVGSPDPPA